MQGKIKGRMQRGRLKMKLLARRQLLSFVLGRDAFKAGRGMGKLDDQKEGFRGALIGGSCRGKVAAGG